MIAWKLAGESGSAVRQMAGSSAARQDQKQRSKAFRRLVGVPQKPVQHSSSLVLPISVQSFLLSCRPTLPGRLSFFPLRYVQKPPKRQG